MTAVQSPPPRYWQASDGNWYPPQVPVAAPAPVLPKVEIFAVVSLVLSLSSVLLMGVTFLPGIIFGHIALSRIKKSNGWKTGRGLAIAGCVLGYAWLAVFVVILALLVLSPAFRHGFNQGYTSSQQ